MDGVDRNASDTIFGFQYQINVGIFFMFHFIKNVKRIKVEGEKQDVEVFLSDNKKYMIQVKSAAKDIYDGNNNSVKLKTALQSLVESDDNKVSLLFYVSNMNNPLNTTTREFENEDITLLKYSELSPKSKSKIDLQINNIVRDKGVNYNIDKNKLVIARIPFFGEFDYERYKFIYSEAKQFLSQINSSLSDKYKGIVKYCESKFLNNGATPKISITKEEFCNWIILIEIEGLDLSSNYNELNIDELDYFEAYDKYKKYIQDKICSYENYSKVYSLYLNAKKNASISLTDFIINEKIKLYNFFFNNNISSDSEITNENKFDVYISQIISYAILRKQEMIKKIKEVANI